MPLANHGTPLARLQFDQFSTDWAVRTTKFGMGTSMSHSDKVFKGSIGRTFHEFEAMVAGRVVRPSRRSEHRFHRSRRRRVCRPWMLRIRNSHNVHGLAGGQRSAIFKFPCHFNVLAHARLPVYRPQRACRWDGSHCRMVERLSRLSGAGHTRGRDHSRNPAGSLLQHLCCGQMAPYKHRKLRFRRAAG